MNDKRLKNWLAAPAIIIFAGCANMTPPELPASHPANPNAPQAQLILRSQIEPYQPPMAAGKQDGMTGMDHSGSAQAQGSSSSGTRGESSMQGMDHAAHGKSAAAPSREPPSPQRAAPDHSMQHMDHANMGSAKDGQSKDGHTSAAGQPVPEGQPTRTVKVTALDSMRFEPQTLNVKAGETIRFIVTNAGKLPHEFVVGDRREQQEHAEIMKKMPDMWHEHGNALTLAPGETKTLTWQFAKAGTIELACHVPGHYEAGMVSKVMVSASMASGKQRSRGSSSGASGMQEDMPGMEHGPAHQHK